MYKFKCPKIWCSLNRKVKEDYYCVSNNNDCEDHMVFGKKIPRTKIDEEYYPAFKVELDQIMKTPPIDKTVADAIHEIAVNVVLYDINGKWKSNLEILPLPEGRSKVFEALDDLVEKAKVEIAKIFAV